MLKLVVDTNLFVSGLILKRGAPNELLNSWRRGDFLLLITHEIIDEIKRVLRYPRIARKYNISEADIEELTVLLETEAVTLNPNVTLTIVKDDPDDDKFIECAVTGKADYIVTGDSHLLSLRRVNDISIVSVNDYFNLLE